MEYGVMKLIFSGINPNRAERACHINKIKPTINGKLYFLIQNEKN